MEEFKGLLIPSGAKKQNYRCGGYITEIGCVEIDCDDCILNDELIFNSYILKEYLGLKEDSE